MMDEVHADNTASNPDAESVSQPESGPDRRSILGAGTAVLMAGGLIGGYGTFFSMAGRYFFPTSEKKAWMFVVEAKEMPEGGSLEFESPVGVKVSVTRKQSQENKGAQKPKEPKVSDFLALSSVCPHLGCRVHWESQNDRFFCPCHNGVFDPNGKAVSGPPAQGGTDLPEYPLRIVNGLLFIEMPYETV